MAEILGVLGGVTASSEIAESLMGLKKLCSTVRDADRKLELILEEIESINRILQAIEALQSQLFPFVRRPSGWEDCQKSCEAVASELCDVILDLQHRIEQCRLFGSIRYALREDKVEALLTRLERAKSTVILAQQP